MKYKTLEFAILFLLVTACVPSATAESGKQAVRVEFDEVVSLRTEGRFEEAIEVLKTIIDGNLQNDDILRRAYTELVFTHLLKGDETAAEKGARRALERFPDLKPDPLHVPPKVAAILDDLRKQMYGGFEITTIPDSCKVVLDDRFVGYSPLTVEYVRTGEHMLELSKAGYFDLSKPTTVAPGVIRDIHYALIPKERSISEWQKIYVGPGISIPVGDAKTYGGTGYGIMGFLRVRPSKHIPVLVRVSSEYVKLGERRLGDVTVSDQTYHLTHDTEMWNIMLAAEYFKKMKLLEPYIGVAGGFYYFLTTTQVDNKNGEIGRESNRITWPFGGAVFAGSRVRVKNNLAFDVNLRYEWVPDIAVFTETFEETHFDFRSVSIFVGIYYSLLYPWK